MKWKVKKEWIIIGSVCALIVALVVGVIILIVDETPDDDTVGNTTSGIHMEATGDPQQTTGADTTVPDTTVPDTTASDTTVPDTTEETTVPETTGESADSTTPSGEDSTTPSKDNSGQGGGTGFEDAPQIDPVAPTKPSTTTSQPQETEPPTPTETMDPEKPVDEYTYNEYMALTPKEKTAFYYKFPSLSAFNRWYNAAKKAADDEKLVIGDGSIDLGELIDP